jgi:hypothetical protein
MMTLENAPPPFLFDGTKLAVFAKFVWARYQLEFDIGSGKVMATSTICFDVPTRGRPVIDLEASDGRIAFTRLNGSAVRYARIESPPFPNTSGGYDVAQYRVVDCPVDPGRHLFTMRHEIIRGFAFSAGGVDCHFEMSDDARRAGTFSRPFLERYLPSNLEFDHYPSLWHVTLIGAVKPHTVLTNGTIHVDTGSMFTIAFPDASTSSSPFFLLAPHAGLDLYSAIESTGLSLPVRVDIAATLPSEYNLHADFGAHVGGYLRYLESRFGPFPQPRLLIVAAPGNCMEYAGAVVSSPEQLLHEMTHCYFGRCVSPADGDAGWIDEGIAYWVADDSPPISKPLSFSSRMGGVSPYRRFTDPDAWEGSNSRAALVMRRLDDLVQSAGGMSRFLRNFFHRHRFESLTTRGFQQELQQFASMDLSQQAFNPYVYGL